MTKKELEAEHRLCDLERSGVRRLIYKTLHLNLRGRGCPLCAKLRKQS